MQPYFLPYIGYWQLLNAVDEYVIYDDVDFIKGGWINRNRILINGRPQYMNIQMRGASSFSLIKEVGIDSSIRWRRKLLSTIAMAYHKAPCYPNVLPVVETIVLCEAENLAEYIAHSIRCVCSYLGIETKLLISSELVQNRSLHGQERVLDICHRLGATEYFNAIGGRTLYDKERFAEAGMELRFLKSCDIAYEQMSGTFIPGLSILDVMMFNPVEQIRSFLKAYELV